MEDEAGAEQHLTQLADLWWFEHLLSLPGVPDEVVTHFGQLFPCRSGVHSCFPPPIAARLYLRHIRKRPSLTDWDLLELLELLELLYQLSCKQHEFRLAASSTALQPPTELVTEVLLQILCDRADPGSSSEEQPALTADAVVDQAHELLKDADLGHLQEDELLQNRLSLLEQLLRGGLEPGHLQRQLRQAFPTDGIEEQLREFVDNALVALGPTTLQLHQEAAQTGRSLPADPLVHFAMLLPEATQAAMDAAAAAVGSDHNHSASQLQAQQQQQQQLGRSTGPVALLGEATGPVLGPQDVEEQPASPALRAQEPEVIRQQATATAPAAAAAGSPAHRAAARATASGASPARGAARAAAAAAADAAGEADGPKARDRARPPKDIKAEAAAARPSRKQLQLEPTTAPPAQTAPAELPVGASRQQEPQQASEGAAAEPVRKPAAAAAAEAPAAQHKRGRAAAGGATAEAGAAAAAAGSGLAEGVPTKPGAKGKSIAAGFVEMLSKPLDGIAAAVSGGIAAAVGRSPSTSVRERKLCGAPQAGVQGKAVAWESPFKSSNGSPSQDPSGRHRATSEPRATGAEPAHMPPPAAAAAAAAGGGAAAGRITKAIKRKRAQGEARPPGAAAAAAAAGADSGTTEYQDAREEGASESEGPGQQQELRRRQPLPRARAQGSEGLLDSDEGIDEADSDAGSDDETLQQRQNKQRQQREAAAGRAAGRPASSSGGAAAAAAAAGGSSRAHVRGAAGGAGDLFDGSDYPKKRRKTVRWSREEENLLVQLVAQEGEGQWAIIHKLGAGAFNPSRTQVDLKDKWRNLKKYTNVS